MGGILGGGSSINFMMYTRAQGADYDSWKTPGWTAKDMLPLLNKLETFHQNEEGINRSKHGYEGPIHVSDGGFRGKSEHQFMETVKKMGFKEIVDLQDLNQVGGFSVSGLKQKISDAKNGETDVCDRDGNDTCHPMESVRMQLIAISILYFKTGSIQISTF